MRQNPELLNFLGFPCLQQCLLFAYKIEIATMSFSFKNPQVYHAQKREGILSKKVLLEGLVLPFEKC